MTHPLTDTYDLAIRLRDTTNKILSNHTTVGMCKGELHLLQLVHRAIEYIDEYGKLKIGGVTASTCQLPKELPYCLLKLDRAVEQLLVQLHREARGEAREQLGLILSILQHIVTTFGVTG